MAPLIAARPQRRDKSPAPSPPATGQVRRQRARLPVGDDDEECVEAGNEAPATWDVGLTAKGYVVLFAVLSSMFVSPVAVALSVGLRLNSSPGSCTDSSLHGHMMETWLSHDGELVPAKAHQELMSNFNAVVKANTRLKEEAAAALASKDAAAAAEAAAVELQRGTEARLNASLAQQKALEVQLGEGAAERSQLDEEGSALRAKVAALEERLAKAAADGEQRETALWTEVKRLQATVAATEKQREEAVAAKAKELATLDAQHAQVRAQLDALAVQHASCTDVDLPQRDALLAQLNERLGECADESARCEKRKEAHERAHAVCEQEAAASEARAAALTERNSALQMRNGALSEDLSRIVRKMSDGIKRANEQNAEVTRLAQSLGNMNDEVTNMLRDVSDPEKLKAELQAADAPDASLA